MIDIIDDLPEVKKLSTQSFIPKSLSSSGHLSVQAMTQIDVQKLFKSMAKGAMMAKISMSHRRRNSTMKVNLTDFRNKKGSSGQKMRESKIDVKIQYVTSDFTDITPYC